MSRSSAYPWLKLWIEIVDDSKIGTLDDHLWRRFVEFLCLAQENRAGGLLPPLTKMAWKLRTTEDEIEQSLVALSAINVVHLNGQGWLVTQFEKRQGKQSAAEKQKRYRERIRIQEEEEEEEEEDRYHSVTVTNDTEHNASVTLRNELPKEEAERLVGIVMRLQEWWLELTGGALPKDRDQRVEAYFVPLNNLLRRVLWSERDARDLLEGKRDQMLSDGKTPYRPAAVVPAIFADLDGLRSEDEAADASYQLDEVAAILEQ